MTSLPACHPGVGLPRVHSARPPTDAYGYDGDRQVFRAVVPERARVQAGVIRRTADAGDPVSIALLPIADLLDRSAADVEALPDDFWLR